MKTIILDAEKMGEKETAHAYLKNILELPEYYGGNLDALYDCVSEMTDVKILVIHAEAAGDYYRRVAAVLEDAAAFEEL